MVNRVPFDLNSASDQSKIQQITIDPTNVTDNSSISSTVPNAALSYQNLTSCPASTSSSILRAALQKPAATSTSNPPTPTATPTLPASQLSFQLTSQSGQSNASKQFHNTFNMTLQSNPYNFTTNNQTDSPFGYPVYQANTNSFNNNTNIQQQQQQQQFASLSQPPPPPIQTVTAPVYNENTYFTSLSNGSNQMIVASPSSSISTSSSPSSSSSSSSSSSLSAGMTYLNRSQNTQLSKSKSPLVSQQDQQLFNNNVNISSNNINGYSLLGTTLNQPIYQNLNSNLFNNQTTFDPSGNGSRSTNNTLLFAPLTNGANSQNTKPTYYDLNKNIQLQQQSVNTSNTLVGNSCGGQLNHSSNLMYDDISSYQDLLTTNNQNNNSNKTSISCYYD